MWLLGVAGALAVLEWIAVARHNRQLEYFAKPATLLLLLLWFASQTAGIPSPLRWLYLIGLALSLLGDALLMFPVRLLRQGVIAFLFAHLAYVIAFNSDGPLLSFWSIRIAAGLLVLLAIFLVPILQGIKRTGKTTMRIPVILYAVVLGATTWSVLTTFLRPEWDLIDAALVSAGGLFFLGSDIGWAFDQFVRPRPDWRVIQLAAYHVGQFLMAVGVWHHLIALESAA